MTEVTGVENTSLWRRRILFTTLMEIAEKHQKDFTGTLVVGEDYYPSRGSFAFNASPAYYIAEKRGWYGFPFLRRKERLLLVVFTDVDGLGYHLRFMREMRCYIFDRLLADTVEEEIRKGAKILDIPKVCMTEEIRIIYAHQLFLRLITRVP